MAETEARINRKYRNSLRRDRPGTRRGESPFSRKLRIVILLRIIERGELEKNGRVGKRTGLIFSEARSVFIRTLHIMSITPQAVQELLDGVTQGKLR